MTASPERVSPEEMEQRRAGIPNLNDYCAGLVAIVNQHNSEGLPYCVAVADKAGFLVAFGGETRLAALLRAALTDYLRGQGSELELSELPDGLLPEQRRGPAPDGHPYPVGEPLGGG